MKYFYETWNALEADFEFKNFQKALDFVNLVGNIAEISNHHPDITLYSYKYVNITITTHDEGNTLTDKDFALAKNIELSYRK